MGGVYRVLHTCHPKCCQLRQESARIPIVRSGRPSDSLEGTFAKNKCPKLRTPQLLFEIQRTFLIGLGGNVRGSSGSLGTAVRQQEQPHVVCEREDVQEGKFDVTRVGRIPPRFHV